MVREGSSPEIEERAFAPNLSLPAIADADDLILGHGDRIQLGETTIPFLG